MAIKMSVGGKYAGTKREPNYNTAGVDRESGAGSRGIVREFIGSGIKSYPFIRIIHGVKHILTVRAHSVSEANKLAATRGYKTSDRQIKRRRKK